MKFQTEDYFKTPGPRIFTELEPSLISQVSLLAARQSKTLSKHLSSETPRDSNTPNYVLLRGEKNGARPMQLEL